VREPAGKGINPLEDILSAPRKRLSKDDFVQLTRLLISAIEPIARLIDVISRIVR
jgi:hypothetical protein